MNLDDYKTRYKFDNIDPNLTGDVSPLTPFYDSENYKATKEVQNLIASTRQEASDKLRVNELYLRKEQKDFYSSAQRLVDYLSYFTRSKVKISKEDQQKIDDLSVKLIMEMELLVTDSMMYKYEGQNLEQFEDSLRNRWKEYTEEIYKIATKNAKEDDKKEIYQKISLFNYCTNFNVGDRSLFEIKPFEEDTPINYIEIYKLRLGDVVKKITKNDIINVLRAVNNRGKWVE